MGGGVINAIHVHPKEGEIIITIIFGGINVNN